MHSRYKGTVLLFVVALASALGQQSPPEIGLVPRLIRFSSSLPENSRPVKGDAVAALFSIYRDQYDGAPLWSESQNVQVDREGGYNAMLGATRNEGMPIELFNTAEPRWLEVEIGGVKEPRVQIGSVPYAMVAADAQTLGGLPPSAYLRAAPSESSTTTDVITTPVVVKPDVNNGNAGYLGVFTNSMDLTSSVLFQSGNTISIGGTTSLGAMTLIGSAASSDTPGMALYNSAGGSGASVSLDMYNTSFNGGIPQAKMKALDDGAYSDHLTFWTKNPGGPNNPVTERLRITSNGNVGIGTTAPGGKLEVAGNLKISTAGSSLTFPDGTSMTTAATGGGSGGATVAVGTTTTGAAGTSAQVTNSGTATNAVLNFTIPQGANGTTFTSAAAVAAVATLRWGFATISTIPVGQAPNGVAFDGTNIWVTISGSNMVTKLLASSGAILGNYTVGTNPHGVAWDGTNIWVANAGSNNVTKLLASTGGTVGTYNVGAYPTGVAFDGANIWVVNQGSNTVTKLQASTGATVGTYPVGSAPYGVAFDGTNIWVTNIGSSNVTRLLASTGATLLTYTVGADPPGVAFDGSNIWVANGGPNTVTKLLASTGATVGSYTVGTSPAGVAFDGTNVWVTNSGSNTVTKLLASTGAVLGTYTVGNNPSGIAFDGTNIWVANFGSNSLSKIGPSAQ